METQKMMSHPTECPIAFNRGHGESLLSPVKSDPVYPVHPC
jgi:hypothetical protein